MNAKDKEYIVDILDYLAESRERSKLYMQTADDTPSYEYHKGQYHAYSDVFSAIEEKYDGKLTRLKRRNYGR